MLGFLFFCLLDFFAQLFVMFMKVFFSQFRSFSEVLINDVRVKDRCLTSVEDRPWKSSLLIFDVVEPFYDHFFFIFIN